MARGWLLVLRQVHVASLLPLHEIGGWSILEHGWLRLEVDMDLTHGVRVLVLLQWGIDLYFLLWFLSWDLERLLRGSGSALVAGTPKRALLVW